MPHQPDRSSDRDASIEAFRPRYERVIHELWPDWRARSPENTQKKFAEDNHLDRTRVSRFLDPANEEAVPCASRPQLLRILYAAERYFATSRAGIRAATIRRPVGTDGDAWRLAHSLHLLLIDRVQPLLDPRVGGAVRAAAIDDVLQTVHWAHGRIAGAGPTFRAPVAVDLLEALGILVSTQEAEGWGPKQRNDVNRLILGIESLGLRGIELYPDATLRARVFTASGAGLFHSALYRHDGRSRDRLLWQGLGRMLWATRLPHGEQDSVFYNLIGAVDEAFLVGAAAAEDYSLRVLDAARAAAGDSILGRGLTKDLLDVDAFEVGKHWEEQEPTLAGYLLKRKVAER